MKKIIFFFAFSCLSTLAIADPIWIDVRSAEEYAHHHINGDLNIPHEEITSYVQKLSPDRNTEINLYCRTGRRSGIATAELKKAGYKNIINTESIEKTRKMRLLDQ